LLKCLDLQVVSDLFLVSEKRNEIPGKKREQKNGKKYIWEIRETKTLLYQSELFVSKLITLSLFLT